MACSWVVCFRAVVLFLSPVGCGTDEAGFGVDLGSAGKAGGDSVNDGGTDRGGAEDSGAGGSAGKAGSSGGFSGFGATGGDAGGSGSGGGSGEAPGCLPDGTGSIALKFSGPVSFDETRDNDYVCLASFSGQHRDATVLLRVDNPPPESYGVVSITLPEFAPGETGTITFERINLAVTPGGLWSDPDSSTPDVKNCTFNVSENQPLPSDMTKYRVVGTLSCSGPVPGLPSPVTVERLSFSARFDMSD